MKRLALFIALTSWCAADEAASRAVAAILEDARRQPVIVFVVLEQPAPAIGTMALPPEDQTLEEEEEDPGSSVPS